MSGIDPEIDRVLKHMIKRNPKMEDPKNKIELLAGEITQVFMQGVRVGESVARKRYLMDSTVKPVDLLLNQGQRQQADDAGN